MAAAKEKDSPEAQAVRRWKQPEAKRAGDFAAVLKDVSLGVARLALDPWKDGGRVPVGTQVVCPCAETQTHGHSGQMREPSDMLLSLPAHSCYVPPRSRPSSMCTAWCKSAATRSARRSRCGVVNGLLDCPPA